MTDTYLARAVERALPLAEMASDLKTSERTVLRRLRAENLHARWKRNRRGVPPRHKAQGVAVTHRGYLAEAAQAGLPYRTMAAHMGVSPEWVSQLLEKLDLKIAHQRARALRKNERTRKALAVAFRQTREGALLEKYVPILEKCGYTLDFYRLGGNLAAFVRGIRLHVWRRKWWKMNGDDRILYRFTEPADAYFVLLPGARAQLWLPPHPKTEFWVTRDEKRPSKYRPTMEWNGGSPAR